MCEVVVRRQRSTVNEVRPVDVRQAGPRNSGALCHAPVELVAYEWFHENRDALACEFGLAPHRPRADCAVSDGIVRGQRWNENNRPGDRVTGFP